MALQPSRIYLTHYGSVEDPQPLSQVLHEEIDAYVAIARPFAETDDPVDALEAELWAHFQKRLDAHGNRQSPAERERLLAMDVRLCAQGLHAWLQRRNG